MTSAIIETRNLAKQYDPPDGLTAVSDLSLTIEEGEIFSLLGPNGAGKSTTISMLSGLVSPTQGEATVAGHSLRDEIMAVKQTIGVVPQELALYDAISARENLNFWGRMYGLHGARLKQRVTAVLDIAGLADRAADKVETFSGGMKRRINIAVGLLHEPAILFMDEPTVGIDPQSRRRILDTVKRLNQDGMTVLYTTHYMEEAEELSDRIGIIDHGELIAVGTLPELTATLGHLDTIRLQLGVLPAAVSGLQQLLAVMPGVTQVDGDADGQFIVQTTSADTVLPSLIRTLTESGCVLRQIEVQEPNLEAVFLQLTGRALRD